MAYTRETLLQDLQRMGLKPADTIMMHSSMKAIGDVEGGADTVIDACMEYFSEGLFMTPSHTWAQMSESYCVFDPETEPACVGIIPNLFMKRPEVLRSLHPTHSVAAYGKEAAAYIQGDERCTSPCTPGGSWCRLYEAGAKILLVGVTHFRNTYMHAVEELLDVPDRLTEKKTRFYIKMPDGTQKEVFLHRHYNTTLKSGAIAGTYDKLREAFYWHGAAKDGKLGDADCILCDAKGIYDVMKMVLDHEINCLIDRETIPEEWWKKEIVK